MESFYGGKSGFSFIIVKSFSSVAEMVENFQKGPEYSTVHYDEHVLINTKNKNHPDNGKIYRRGYDYTNSLGGAIYIGSIVGPSGPAPMLELTTLEDVKNKQTTAGTEDKYTEGAYSPPVSLVPGKDGNTYNDDIEWACCCIRDENGEDAIAYIGFKFPYTVIDFTAQSVDPYYNRSNNTNSFVNQDLVSRTDNNNHPFYEKWDIKVPKGIKGDSFKNFRIMTADTSIQDYTGRQDDITNRRQVLVCDYYHYDKNISGEPISIYLGDYNTIEDIKINENGNVTIKYTHDDDSIFPNLLKWITKVTLDNDTGHFTVEYNNLDKNGNPITYETDLSWVKNVYLNDNQADPNSDYRFHIVYTTGEDIAIGDPVNFILETAIDKTDYHLLVYYSNANYRDAIPDGQKRSYNGKDGWLDLGGVKENSGILIGLNIPLSEAPNLDDISVATTYLNNLYPDGLTDPKYYGKIVTIGDEDKNKKFYAFDYDKEEWYYLGSFNTDISWTLVGGEDDADIELLKTNVAVGGLWFVLEGEDD